jgi:SAM-dependent methyltransferase
MAPTARYDGIAEWYDANHASTELGEGARSVALRLLGDGPGRLLDVGCGGGLDALAFGGRGWSVVGVDVSADQLRLARERGCAVVRADAHALPFDDGSYDAAVSIFTHTDVEDFPQVVREIARVLRAGGAFVYLGVHPCFVGPHAFVHGRDVPELHPGYREPGWSDDAPGIWREGLRAKVGAVHLPLAAFLDAFLDAGLVLERVEEPGEREYPHAIALRARR